MGRDPLLFEIISHEQIEKIKKNQAETLSIVKQEKERLTLKQANMDADANNADRMLLLNQSYRDRQHQYLVIMVLFLIVFGICLGIVVLQNRFGYSSFIMDVLLVIVIGAGLVAAFSMMSNIFTRDPIEFDKIGQTGGNLLDVTKLAEMSDTASAVANAVTTADTSVCKGAACCDETIFKWNPTTLKCQHI